MELPKLKLKEVYKGDLKCLDANRPAIHVYGR